jgi:phosphate-selective porin
VVFVVLPSSVLVDDPAVPTPDFHLSGYIQGRFTNVADTKDRFEIRRARLVFSGDLDEHLSFTIQTDVVKLPYLLDASVEVKPSRAFKIVAGQFKLPFSMESLTPDNEVAPIERAKVINSFAPGRDLGVQARDTGVELAGKIRNIDYAGGVFTGALIVNSPQAEYHASAFRAVAHFGSLAIGGDLYRSFSTLEKSRQSVEAVYRRGPFTAQSEFIWGRDARIERRGGYVLGVWRWSKRWQGVARDDWYTSNIDKRNTTTDSWLIGANYYVFPKVRIQANGGLRREPSSLVLSGLFLTQLQVGF